MASYLAFSRDWHDWVRFPLPDIGLVVRGEDEMKGFSILEACKFSSKIALVAHWPNSKLEIKDEDTWQAGRGFAICEVSSLQSAARLIMASYGAGYEQLSGSLRWAKDVLRQLGSGEPIEHELSDDIFSKFTILRDVIYSYVEKEGRIVLVDGDSFPQWSHKRKAIEVGRLWPLLANTLHEALGGAVQMIQRGR